MDDNYQDLVEAALYLKNLRLLREREHVEYCKRYRKNKPSKPKIRIPGDRKLTLRVYGWKFMYGLSLKDVQDLLDRQDGKCALHGGVLTLLTCSVDHIVAKSLGGSHGTNNFQLLCLPCNLGKGKMTGREYVEHCKNVAAFHYHNPKILRGEADET